MSDIVPDPCHEQAEALLAHEIDVVTPALEVLLQKLNALIACRQNNPWIGNWLVTEQPPIANIDTLKAIRRRVRTLKTDLENLR